METILNKARFNDLRSKGKQFEPNLSFNVDQRQSWRYNITASVCILKISQVSINDSCDAFCVIPDRMANTNAPKLLKVLCCCKWIALLLSRMNINLIEKLIQSCPKITME